MIRELVTEFLAQECSLSVRHNLLEEIIRHRGRPVVRDHTFNRFNVRVDFENDRVVIDDDLDISDRGSCGMLVEKFVAAIRGHRPSS
jgi:hypothetical protein